MNRSRQLTTRNREQIAGRGGKRRAEAVRSGSDAHESGFTVFDSESRLPLFTTKNEERRTKNAAGPTAELRLPTVPSRSFPPLGKQEEDRKPVTSLPALGRPCPLSSASTTAICIWIPHFPLRAEERRRPELAHKPTAIVSATDTRRLWQVSPIARRQSVQVGMTVSQAIGLCSTLTILEPDPVYYDEQFSTLLLALGRISPVVEPVELGRAYVGVDGLDRLIGNAEEQIRAVESAITEANEAVADRGGKRREEAVRSGNVAESKRRWRRSLPVTAGHSTRLRGRGGKRREGAVRSGWTHDAHGSWLMAGGGVGGGGMGWHGLRLGWGRGKFAAWVAACKAKPGQPLVLPDGKHDEFLRAQSVAVLPVEGDTHRRLWQLGIKTLGDLAALPVEAVVSQFGREGRTAWQLASGLIVEPVVGKPPPENIVTNIEFPLPVADRNILSYAIRKLIDRALRDPLRIGWRVYSLRARAQLEQGASWLAEVTLKDPSADCEHICAPVNAKFEQAPPTGAVESITVEITSLVRGTSELQLFARDSSSAARAGRRRALRWASREIRKRLNRSMLHHVIEVHPWSRLPERRYALIDYDP